LEVIYEDEARLCVASFSSCFYPALCGFMLMKKLMELFASKLSKGSKKIGNEAEVDIERVNRTKKD